MPIPPLVGPPVAVTATTINALLRSGYDHETGWEYADLVPVSPTVGGIRETDADADAYLLYHTEMRDDSVCAAVVCERTGSVLTFGPFSDEPHYEFRHNSLTEALSWAVQALNHIHMLGTTEYVSPPTNAQ